MYCTDIPDPSLFIFSGSVPALLYYSHIPSVIIALLLGFFVVKSSKKEDLLASKLLFLISISFFVWNFFDLILWTNNDSSLIISVWSTINLFEILITALTLYFSYLFLEKKDAPFKIKLFIVSLLIIYALFVPTTFNLSEFTLDDCGVEQGMLTIYYYLLEGVLILWLIGYLIKKVISSKKEDVKFLSIFAVGAICFSASFSGANLVSSLTERWDIIQYGLFGMPVFMAFLGYLIVKYQAFNIRLFATEALVVSMVLLTGSQFFFIRSQVNMVLTAITLLMVAVFGRYLIKVTKDEARRREEAEFAAARERELRKNAEDLAYKLRHLNEAKTQFLLSTQHHLRSPLTIIQGYLSLISDGTYGPVSNAVKEKIDVSFAAAQKLINLVNEMLDVANFQMNKNKISRMPVDVVKILQEIIDDLSKNAQTKNIYLRLNKQSLEFPSIDVDARGIKEAFYNIIDNAIKYTREGGVTVTITPGAGKICIMVSDTGIGLSDRDQRNLFNKTFERGSRAKEVNVTGKGIGLYLAGQMIINNNGIIHAESEGRGKGTTFIVELPEVGNDSDKAGKNIPALMGAPKPPARS